MVKIKGLQGYKSYEHIEEEGVWTPIGPDIEFKIRRMRSKTVDRARDRIFGPHERAMRGKDLPEGLDTELTIKLLSEAVVADWRGKGMVDDNDQPFPFNPENAKVLFSDPETGKDLRSTIIQTAMDGSVFVPDNATEGNSASSSSGSSSGGTEQGT